MTEANSSIYKTWVMLLDKEQAGGFVSLSGEEKRFYSIYLLEHETYRGGLEVWFNQGEHHNQVSKALGDIGAYKSARIIEDAMKFVFPEGVAPLNETERRSYIPNFGDASEAWFNRLDQFNDAYCQDPDNLEPLLIAYARKYNFPIE